MLQLDAQSILPTPPREFGVAQTLGTPGCRASVPALPPAKSIPGFPWEPGASLQLRGDVPGREPTAPTRGEGASLSPPRRWVLTGTESNICSTTTPYRQPLPVFARTLRPLGGRTPAPPGTRYAPTAGAPGAGSAHSGSGAAEAEHVPTLRPAPGDGDRRGHGGDPAASGADQVPALRGVWLPSSPSSGRRRLCHRVCVLQEAEK